MVNLVPILSLFDHDSRRRHNSVNNEVPLCFEDMDVNHGLMLYETNLPAIEKSTNLPLVINSLRDRGMIFVDGVSVSNYRKYRGYGYL